MVQRLVVRSVPWLFVLSLAACGGGDSAPFCDDPRGCGSGGDGAAGGAGDAAGDGGGADAGARAPSSVALWGPPVDRQDPWAGVATLRVLVETADDGAPTAADAPFHREAVPFSLPLDRTARVTVEGVNGAGAAVSRGRSTWFEVGGVPPAEVPVFLMQLDSFAPTTARSGAASRPATARVGATATLLEDGRVLIVGGGLLSDTAGDPSDPAALTTILRTAELFDPRTGEFVPISTEDDATQLFSARAFHQAVRLPADGPDRVVLFGGVSTVDGGLPALASVEVFDPATRTFSHDAPPMATARAQHSATVVDDEGRVLLVGGRDAAAASWELWDPSLGPIKNGPLNVPRWNHTATLVPDAYSGFDAVFLLGGEDAASVHNSGELYLVENQEVPRGLIPLVGPTAQEPERTQPRTLHQTVWLKGQGLVYFIGGYEDKAREQPLDRVDVFQVNCPIPEGGDIGDCWRRDVGFRLGSPRGLHTATELPGNAILIAGGCGPLDAAEPCRIGPAEVIFQADRVVDNPDGSQTILREVKLGLTREPVLWPRAAHQAVRLQSDHVLLLGGVRTDGGGRAPVADSELFNPL